jgi:predicted aspartyl protease
MGTFRTTIEIGNVARRSRNASVTGVLVDTGSECTWIPAPVLERLGVKREKKDVVFVMANGQTITRNVGFAIVRIGEAFTVDEVVFGEPGDHSLLGARTLEGLNLTVDSGRKRLIAAGPLPAAAA